MLPVLLLPLLLLLLLLQWSSFPIYENPGLEPGYFVEFIHKPGGRRLGCTRADDPCTYVGLRAPGLLPGLGGRRPLVELCSDAVDLPPSL